jgi:D-alanine-D-alanine ligase
MKICILSDAYEGSESPLKAVDLPTDPTPYFAEHQVERVVLTKATAVRDVIRLAAGDFDVFVNLCDGAWDEDRPGIEVVQALERSGVAFTGATSEFYEPSREAMKRVCRYWGVSTPAGVEVRGADELGPALAALRFPLLVKHPSSYSSIGMTRDSRVETPAALEREVRRMVGEYGAALVEEFIEGREFSVLVAEDPDQPGVPTAYEPVEVTFPPGETFKHFALKWVDYHGLDCVPVADELLAERLKEAARRLFVGLRGAGYGRCDVRVDADGEPWMLEINANCGVFYPLDDPGTADLILDASPGGHRAFADQILRAALARRDRRRRPWAVRCAEDGGYGTYAGRAIAAGEVIERHEEKPHHLVTRSHVEEHWSPLHRRWFEQFAWPLTDEVWVMWSPDPDEWRPLNHSCDPSAWLEGLDVVARRDLAPGDEITLDYATFCTEPLREFPCACGAEECRGTVRGGDHLEDFVARYGDHVSDHVRRRREALARSRGSVELASRRRRSRR